MTAFFHVLGLQFGSSFKSRITVFKLLYLGESPTDIRSLLLTITCLPLLLDIACPSLVLWFRISQYIFYQDHDPSHPHLPQSGTKYPRQYLHTSYHLIGGSKQWSHTRLNRSSALFSKRRIWFWEGLEHRNGWWDWIRLWVVVRYHIISRLLAQLDKLIHPSIHHDHRYHPGCRAWRVQYLRAGSWVPVQLFIGWWEGWAALFSERYLRLHLDIRW